MVEFKLNGEFIALCDLLKIEGLANSGGQAKAMIADGIVIVDGEVELRKTAKMRVGNTIELMGHTVKII